MPTVDNQNVQLDKIKMYAMGVSVDQPYAEPVWAEVKIEEGPPAWYPGAIELRKISFNVVLHGKIPKLQESLRTLSGKVVVFTSTYIGSFNCFVTQKHTVDDGTVDTLKVAFTIQEV